MSSLQSVSNGDMELHAVCFYPPSPTPHQRHYHGNISKSNSHSGITANTEECPKRQPVHFHSHSWRSIFRCPPHGHSPVYFPLKANYIAAAQGQTKLLYFKHEHAFTRVLHHTHTHTHSPTHWHAQRKRQTPAAALFTAAGDTDSDFWPVCGKMHWHVLTGEIFFFIVLFPFLLRHISRQVSQCMTNYCFLFLFFFPWGIYIRLNAIWL